MSYSSEIKEKIAQTVPELTNTSNSSIWSRIVEVFAQVLNTITLNISNSETVVTNAARSLRVAGAQYYIDKATAFQYGDSLTLIDPTTYSYGYSTVDATKQIIKQVSIYVTSENGIIKMTACTQDSVQNISLTSDQLSAFTAYMQAVSPIGIALFISSPTPSIVSCQQLIIRYYNTYSLPTIKTNVQSVLQTTQNAIKGNAPIYINDIETSLSSINGVRDAYFSGITCDGVQPANGFFQPDAGYFNFDQSITTLSPSVVQFIPVR